MEYNTDRTQLIMPEYGRNIQQLVEHCKTLPTKEERNEMALAIVEFMGQRNPHLRDEENYKHKLWDHLFILADYDLDVDSPYTIVTKEELAEKPRRMDYPSFDNDYKFYGKSILQLIEMAIKLNEGDEKDALIQVIANNMKKSGGFIPGIRPGKPTSDYLNNILNYIVFIGACGLVIVCIIPIIASGLFSVGSLSFGGTSLIIIAGVILETIKAVESMMLVRNYKGFLND